VVEESYLYDKPELIRELDSSTLESCVALALLECMETVVSNYRLSRLSRRLGLRIDR
jgi:hypothetical protein